MLKLPLLIEPAELLAHLDKSNLLIIDLCKNETYQRCHIPNAIHVMPSQLVEGKLPATGKLPSNGQLTKLFSSLGLTPEKHVVVYDDEGGGWAGRFIWTLDVIGHQYYSYLNGGLHAWLAEGYVTEDVINKAVVSDYIVNLNDKPIADKAYILAHLDDSNTVIWDARSPEEYHGKRLAAKRGGHIPGAVNYEWTQGMDFENNLRVREKEKILSELSVLGITSDKTIITHCQSHHRSGFTYLLAKILGFQHIKAYPGSWSEWGNELDTPVEN